MRWSREENRFSLVPRLRLHLLFDDKERVLQRHSSSSLNLKPGPRLVSPRRSRGTLGESAIAPRPRAHRWDEIPEPALGTVHPLAGKEPASLSQSLVGGGEGEKKCGRESREPRQVIGTRVTHGWLSSCDVLTSAPAPASLATIYSIFRVARAPARRAATPRGGDRREFIDSVPRIWGGVHLAVWNQ